MRKFRFGAAATAGTCGKVGTCGPAGPQEAQDVLSTPAPIFGQGSRIASGGRPCRSSLPKGFTLIELLVVVAIIAILAALVLSTAGYVQKKGATSRAEGEIAALSAALDSYKADMGDYPTGTNGSASGTAAPGTNNAFLRAALAPNGSNSLNPLNKIYFEFSGGMTPGGKYTNATNVAVLDPFGEGYGYMYPGATNRSGSNFFDLWSRAGTANTNAWIKNW